MGSRLHLKHVSEPEGKRLPLFPGGAAEHLTLEPAVFVRHAVRILVCRHNNRGLGVEKSGW